MYKKSIIMTLFLAAMTFAGYKYHSAVTEPSINIHKANIEAIAEDDEVDGYLVVTPKPDDPYTNCVCGGKGKLKCCY